jgi:phosphohistidine phosphatase
MKLLLIRHAIAEDFEEFARGGLADDLRPLTADGRRKMERGARGLAALLSGLDLVASSPLVRARQTAEIVAAAFGGPPLVETDTLVSGADPRRFLAWLAQRPTAGVVAAVGHQPHLGLLAARLVGAGRRPAVAVKKGSALCFELAPAPAAGAANANASATLLWALAPAHLRRLGER